MKILIKEELNGGKYQTTEMCKTKMEEIDTVNQKLDNLIKTIEKKFEKWDSRLWFVYILLITNLAGIIMKLLIDKGY